jgi:hypothetical protein
MPIGTPEVNMRTLVLYFSNTGNTRKVGEVLAKQTGAEFGEITCSAYLRWYGPVLMAWDIFTGGRPPVDTLAMQATHYDLIILGSPVWGARCAPPVRSVLRNWQLKADRLALFVTCRGTSPNSPPERAIAEMTQLAPMPPLATAIFREREIHNDQFIDSALAFTQKLLPAAQPNHSSRVG